MTQQQVATNHAAVRALAATMERAAGHEIPDVLTIAARAATELLAAGYRRVETIPPRGNGGSEQARAAARQATADAIAAAKASRLAAIPVPMATQRQLTTLAIALSEDGTSDRTDRLAWCSAMVGRELTSSSELTRNEASRLIDAVTGPPPAPEPPRTPVEHVSTPVHNPVDDDPGPTEPEEPWDPEPQLAYAPGPTDPIY
ncbi:hypothetical protein TEK04_19505 [Klenkia sp. LSe6-5]|uniref:DUF222 domain-containing protein n=1 Tax=Klenkia sesuvii TaxID=3103137 RepID=A0ABU8DZ37_9ACTN